jgi:RNA polymerase sigma factor (sigma-70 family)
VLGLCQRMLSAGPDSEDAFQATFLVLIRKAHTLHQRDLLANWLYGVAYRIAVRARQQAARRRTQELPLVDLPARPAAPLSREVQAVIDEEMQRLPERYRRPLVLCYLRGQTQDETAQQLGLLKATLATRLARGRKRLWDCLKRRGIVISAATTAALLTPAAWAAELPLSSPETALHQIVIGLVTQSKAVPVPVDSLVQGAVHEMKVARMQRILSVLALVLLLGALGFLGHRLVSARLAHLPGAVPPGENERFDVLVWKAAEVYKIDVKHGGSPCVATTPDGNVVLAGRDDGSITIWERSNGKIKSVIPFTMHECCVRALSVAGDGITVASASADGIVKVWDLKTRVELLNLSTSGAFTQQGSLALSPDGKLLALATGNEDTFAVIDIASGKQLGKVLQAEGVVWHLGFSLDGKSLTCASPSGGFTVWDVAAQEKKLSCKPDILAEAGARNDCRAMSPDGRYGVSLHGRGGKQCTVHLWDMANGKLLATFSSHMAQVNDAVFRADGTLLATASHDGTVKIWDVKTGKELTSFRIVTVPGIYPERKLAFSADGKTLVVGGVTSQLFVAEKTTRIQAAK